MFLVSLQKLPVLSFLASFEAAWMWWGGGTRVGKKGTRGSGPSCVETLRRAWKGRKSGADEIHRRSAAPGLMGGQRYRGLTRFETWSSMEYWMPMLSETRRDGSVWVTSKISITLTWGQIMGWVYRVYTFQTSLQNLLCEFKQSYIFHCICIDVPGLQRLCSRSSWRPPESLWRTWCFPGSRATPRPRCAGCSSSSSWWLSLSTSSPSQFSSVFTLLGCRWWCLYANDCFADLVTMMRAGTCFPSCFQLGIAPSKLPWRRACVVYYGYHGINMMMLVSYTTFK